MNKMAVFLCVLVGLLVQQATGQGVTLQHDTVAVFNFDLLDHSVIGDSSDPEAHLICRTDNTSCCTNSDNPNGEGFGDWYYPEGSVVNFFSELVLPAGQIYRMQRNSRTVQLFLDGSATASTANGLYRCELPNQNNVIQTRYVGLYTPTTGVVSISQEPQLSLTSVDPLEFTLTSTTTGGPPTSTFWTLPNTAMVQPGDTFSQTVVDAVAATVEHTLTVTGRVTGVYTFSTINARSGSLDSRNIVIEAANPPSDLMAVQSGLTSVDVSWTAPAPGGATRTGYLIFYETGGSEQSVDVGAGATSHTLTGLSGATYSISIVALSDTLASTVLGPALVTVEVLEAPVVTTQVLSPTSIRVTFTQPSGVPAERYDIQYTRVTGASQTLCGSVGDTGSATDVQSPYTIGNLQEFSIYSITVTVFAGVVMRGTTEQAMTSPAASTAAPRDLMNTNILSTSITVQWDPVECIERNGVIDNYIVRFGPEGGAQSERTVQSEGTDQPGTYTASELTPFIRYSFEVAAMTSAGSGLFTVPLTVMTNEDVPGVVDLMEASTTNSTSITILWNEPPSPNGIITQYEVRYWPEADPTDIATVNNGLSCTFTLSNLETGATFVFEVTAFTSIGRGASSSQTASAVTTRCPQCSCSTETTVAVVVVLVVLIIAASVSAVIITVLVLKHRQTPPRAQEPQPTEGVVLKTFSDSTKPPPAISTAPCAAYGPVAQGRDGDPHTYEYIAAAPASRSRDQPDESNYESTT